MKNSMISLQRTVFGIVWIFLILIASCNKDDEGFAITNDLRVLKVDINGNRAESGVTDLSVLSTLDLTFSHGLNKSSFEGGLQVSPNVAYNISYDGTGSIVTLTPDVRFDYDTEYTITLPAGNYGANGEKSVEDISFVFKTSPFQAPRITLTPDRDSFFEGETVTVTANIADIIFDDVTFDLVFGGSAEEGSDFTVSESSITIPAGETSATFTVTANGADGIEGQEDIEITLTNVVNATNNPEVKVTLILGDTPPKLELKGVMELDNYIDGAGGRVRAIHLRVLEDIPDLSIFHIQIASNGAAPDPTDIDFAFPANSAVAGENLFVVRDEDAALAAAYFGSCYSDFTEFQTPGMTHNGDDAILLYENGVAIESYGEPGVDGTGEYWEYTDSWSYKIGGKWEYAGVACVENAVGEATNETSLCQYPFCSPIQLQGVSSLLWDGSGTNGGKFVHVRVNRDIPDLSRYGLGVANNGGGTDGIEFTFPSVSASEGDHILVAREPETIAGYFGGCYNGFANVFQSDAMSQNGDDAIELFDGMDVIETYGDANVDGTGQPWDYANTWAYKVGKWINAPLDCGAGSTSTQGSSCTYLFCTE
ncbi:Ig-like domain-containing protein [Fulvivirga sedimenti]|uniref:Ig-like domain-containing protein n=1 Tax=Fulvivirga sedimenti TaxID=2879465 RepID=A0A9X1L1K9_9BACT|nr:Ig-like domain-containing protein [Fulvivirga sedimenti]MCA6078934.1 Ig-like domain-containing protein [Fulvivirga sedimenti]